MLTGVHTRRPEGHTRTTGPGRLSRPGPVSAHRGPGQISPCASIASATSSKPAMFAPTT